MKCKKIFFHPSIYEVYNGFSTLFFLVQNTSFGPISFYFYQVLIVLFGQFASMTFYYSQKKQILESNLNNRKKSIKNVREVDIYSRNSRIINPTSIEISDLNKRIQIVSLLGIQNNITS